MNTVNICTVTDFDTTSGSGNSSIFRVYNIRVNKVVKFVVFWDVMPGFSEMLVHLYQATRSHILEDKNLHNHNRENWWLQNLWVSLL